MNIFSYNTAPFIVTLALVLLIFIIFIAVKKINTSREKITEDFIGQLATIKQIQTPQATYLTKKTTILSKWHNYWGTLIKKAGLVDPMKYTNEQLGSLVILGVLVFYLIVTVISRNFGIGLVPIFSIYMLSVQFLENKIEKRQEIFDEQIPAFLSLLKANVQAGETPERALINAIDETDSPLYDELKTARSLIEIGSLQTALGRLRQETSSEVLSFLCGCIELSASVGANLEEQLETIEEMLEGNRKLKRKLKVAIAQSKPLMLLSAVAIPFIFIYTYVANEQLRSFWFKEPISWLAFIAVILIYGGGTLAVKKLVKKTGQF